MNGLQLIATGGALPGRTVTNEELSRTVDTSDEWITTRTGIRARHWCTEEESAATLAIGMALSGTAQNFAGGVMILLMKPYRVGDYISAQGQSGTVREIKLFSTVITTADNQTIYIPNNSIATAIIDNYSTSETRRVDWTVGISYGDDVDDGNDTNGHVIDLIAPVLVLIAACILGLIYTGGFFEGVDFVTAFANCSASMGLVLGSAIALMFTFVFYRVRGVMTFQDFAACIPEGFKAMVSPMLILTLAWTLSGMTGLLGAKYYVASLLSGSAAALQYLLPIIIFVVAVFLAFATGTSWGTFSILVPIVCHAFPDGEMLVVSIAACLSGAVCGDHCSPISDTTIMASAGAHCSHVNHVSTQLPYAMTAAAISAGCYLLCGAAQAVLGDAANTLTSFVLLACAIVIELVVLSIVKARMGHTGKEEVTKS